MKLQQLRYIWEVAQNGLNVSVTAERLHTSQPGVSKQIRLLESELGLSIFTRNGKQFSSVTPAGQQIVALAGKVLAQVENVRRVAREHCDPNTGTLSIATTHTQARYALPAIVSEFIKRYPRIRLHIQQGTPPQIAEMAAKAQVDMAIATEGMELFEDLVMLPCYEWNRCILVPHGHPLTELPEVNLAQLAAQPLITYVFGFTGRSMLDRAFAAARLAPQIALTAVDADVIKTYVRLGLGVGIVAHMAYDPVTDADLVAIDASHLFDFSVTKIGLRRDVFLHRYMFDFIERFAPHLTRELVEEALRMPIPDSQNAFFKDLCLPRK